jgi:hypothetical protein
MLQIVVETVVVVGKEKPFNNLRIRVVAPDIAAALKNIYMERTDF